MKHGIFDYYAVYPLKKFGLTEPFWAVHIDTLIYTWAAMVVLLVLAFVGRSFLKEKHNIVSLAYEKIIEFFVNLCKDSFGFFNYRYFAFVTSLFLFTLFCCLIGLIPFLDESTKDLNTTFALALCSFVYIQTQKIKVLGFIAYAKKFFQPVFLLAPINIIGELSKLASMSFRLFGNILGGSIIFGMIINLLEQQPIVIIFLSCSCIILALTWLVAHKKSLANTTFSKIVHISSVFVFAIVWTQVFFGLFEGIIQAFVLAMLTTTYLAMGTTNASQEQ